MDRLTQLRGEAGAGGSGDSTLDSTAPSEAFITASDSKYFSLSEDDSTFDISPIKDVSLSSTAGPDKIATTNNLIENLSPIPKKNDLLDSYKIGKQIDAANILSGGVEIFDDNDNSYDGNELIIDEMDGKELRLSEGLPETTEPTLVDNEAIASKEPEVVLQIDGKNVNAINIGNGLYLYRKEGGEELAAVQIIDDDQQQPSFKFLKVRENSEGNLEVYEEIEIEVPKDAPVKEGKVAEKNTSNFPIKDINKVTEPTTSKVNESIKPALKPANTPTSTIETLPEKVKETQLQIDTKNDTNFNGKLMKFNETRKSPVIHSTPNKEGIPLTKTMVDQQLHPNRHMDKVKTIELHTDSAKTKIDGQVKSKESDEKITEGSVQKDELTSKATEAIEKISQTKAETQIKTTEDTEKKPDASSNKTLDDIKQNQSQVQIETASKTNQITVTQVDKQIDSIKSTNIHSEIAVKDKPAEKINKPETKTDLITSEVNTVKTSTEMVQKSELVKFVESDKKESITTTTEVGNSSEKIDFNKEKDCIASKTPIESEKVDVKEDKSNVKVKSTMETLSIKTTDVVLQATKDLPSKVEDQPEIDSKLNIVDIKCDQVAQANIGKEIPVLANAVGKLDSIGSKNLPKDIVTEKVNLNVEDKKDLPLASSKQDAVSKIDLIYNKPLKISKAENEQVDKVISETSSKAIEAKKEVPSSTNKNISNISLDKLKTENAINVNTKDVKNPSAKINILQDVTFDKTVTKFNLDVKSNVTIAKPIIKNENIVADSRKIKLDISVPKETTVKPIPVIVQQTQAAKNLSQNEDSKPIVIGGSKNIGHVKTLERACEAPKLDIQKIANTFIQKFDQMVNKTCLSIEKTPENVSETTKAYTVTKPSIQESNSQLKTLKDEMSVKGLIDAAIKDKIQQPKPQIAKKPIELEKSATDVKTELKKEVPKANVTVEPVNNNHAPVPFGKWTEANRQAFLNKIKETKVPANSSNTNSIKQPNDLNRRDILQKIDSQRHNNAKVQEIAALNKLRIKNDGNSAFTANMPKTITVKPSQEPKLAVKPELVVVKNKPLPAPPPKKLLKPETTTKQEAVNILKNLPNTTFSSSTSTKKMVPQANIPRNDVQNLIDITIEDIINRSLPPKPQDKPTVAPRDDNKPKQATYKLNIQPKEKHNSLDAIEMKMNELHGIPFVERPPHELPKVYNHDIKTYSKESKTKTSKIPNLVPYAKNQPTISKEIVEIDSEEEIIEHVPVTGDIEFNKKDSVSKVSTTDTAPSELSKKESIITEKDFDKFARRNSVTYENCLTVNLESNPQHSAFQPIKAKEPINPQQSAFQPVKPKEPVKKYSRNELLLAEAKSYKSTHKQYNQASNKIQMTSKLMPVNDEALNKNYQSKLQMAYQSALTAKKKMESPITIIEDKPVKVVFVDSNPEAAPSLLNVPGPPLAQATRVSPTKKQPEPDALNTNDSVDSDMLDVIPDGKSHEDNKSKTKHQRKQVLTPVDNPDLELIDASDLNLSIDSPKKKRRTEDLKHEKSPNNVVPKKTYLLGRNTGESEGKPAQDAPLQSLVNAAVSQTNLAVSAASAIDSLVKAAELLESQSDLNTSTASVDSATQQTPVKRGRGRPRKYPLPDGSATKPEAPSPQKKPRLIDAKKPKKPVTSDEDDDDSSYDEALIRENWTMGKINENIVCPICSKLFRSENVVFKHVKHCTGPSPNRSDSDKRSSRRLSKYSQDTESKSSRDSSAEDKEVEKVTPSNATSRLRKSKESIQSEQKDEVIVIEDSPIVQKPERSEPKQHISRKQQVKPKIQPQATSLACETCGKTFRQLSYLASHRLQHRKETAKKPPSEPHTQVDKSVFSCEVCKKEFRKLHHLVNHRLIHNPNAVVTKAARKSSAEYVDKKDLKEQDVNKLTDDQSAAFRCEPCDKSFRKLHHLVEHRETHDGINRQKSAPATAQRRPTNDPPAPPQCDICKKTFRKLHHLSEHKEQHVETSSEKSDDKSVKSSLSTRDIIHECSLCYMVFPNEHSLTKHTVICQRKKKQASKQAKQAEEAAVETVEDKKSETTESEVIEKPLVEKEITPEIINTATPTTVESKPIEPVVETPKPVVKVTEKRPSKDTEPKTPKEKPTSKRVSQTNTKVPTEPEVPAKVKKVEEKPKPTEIIEIEDTPKKKTPVKGKVASSVTKRKKSGNLPPPVKPEPEPVESVESSDDDEVRYMLNPNYNETASESKVFMNVRAQKRNSLQIERPNSKDLVKRRTSLQHPPKILRVKKMDDIVENKESKTVKATNAITKNVVKTVDPVSSSESDDSDVKYSFPKKEKTPPVEEVKKEVPNPKEKKVVMKRKSLTGLAKRKTMGTLAPVRKSPERQIKRRTLEVDHRCDCGALFSSAALLTRHTSVAHTPPRIRRRRSPPPSAPNKPNNPRKSTTVLNTDKKNVKSDKNVKSAAKTPRKSIKNPPTTGKVKRNTAHRGVPLPEKMKMLFAKLNKDDL